MEGDKLKEIVDILDPNGSIFCAVLGRESCFSMTTEIVAKDLRVFNCSMKKIVMVEGNSRNYVRQLDNMIPILPMEESEDN